MPITAEWLTHDEWDALRTLRLRALAEAPTAFGGPGLAGEAGDPEDAWRTRLTTASWLVARRTTEERGPNPLPADAVGLLSLEQRMGAGLPAGWIFSWWIDPMARGSGVSDVMIRAVDARCRELGWTTVGLGTFPANVAARRAFARLGFVAGEEQRGTMPPYPQYIPMSRRVP